MVADIRRALGGGDIVLKDAAYGLIKWKMDMELREHEQIGFTNPDFVRYAESFGARGVQIARTHDLLPALEAALAYDGVTVVACPVNYSENAKLTDRLAALAPAS